MLDVCVLLSKTYFSAKVISHDLHQSKNVILSFCLSYYASAYNESKMSYNHTDTIYLTHKNFKKINKNIGK